MEFYFAIHDLYDAILSSPHRKYIFLFSSWRMTHQENKINPIQSGLFF